MTHRFAAFFIALMLGGVTAGCGLRKIDEKNVETLMHDFQNGTLQLTGSTEAGGNTGWFSSDYVNLNNHRKWVELAKLLIEANTADDLSWYLLGASADGLGYEKAAAQYFTNSINAPVAFCAPGPNYLDSVCAGLKLPEDTYKRLGELK